MVVEDTDRQDDNDTKDTVQIKTNPPNQSNTVRNIEGFDVDKELNTEIFNKFSSTIIGFIFKLVDTTLPEANGQLELMDAERDLIDEAFNPILFKILKKYGIKKEQLSVVIVALVVFAPRLIMIVTITINKNRMKKLQKEGDVNNGK